MHVTSTTEHDRIKGVPAAICSRRRYHRRFKGQGRDSDSPGIENRGVGVAELRREYAEGSGTYRQEDKQQEGEENQRWRCWTGAARRGHRGRKAQTRGVSMQGGARAHCSESSRSRNHSQLPDATGGGGSGAVPAHAQGGGQGSRSQLDKKGAAGCVPAACEVNAAACSYQRGQAVRKPADTGVRALRSAVRSWWVAGRPTEHLSVKDYGRSSASKLLRHREFDSVDASGMHGRSLGGRSPAKRQRIRQGGKQRPKLP
jgi:hypothetical protein